MIKVTTPATSANLGPGFDCMGMAFCLYNTLQVEEIAQGVKIDNWGDQTIPQDESNLIYVTIKNFYERIGKKLPGLHFVQDDHIPMIRGLGSSAACIVSGLLAANALSGAEMTRDELLQIAAEIEGHPDNAVPAFLGGIAVGAMQNEKLYFAKLNVARLCELKFCVMVPAFTLATERARQVLPEKYTRVDAIFNISRAALLTAALTNGDFDLMKAAFDDKIHQPYRGKLIPCMESIFKEALSHGALGVFLSGAGPTLVAVTLSETRFSLPTGWTQVYLKPDMRGARVEFC
ncbi:MAG: homoserine kinase [Clostridiales bacterium]|jgi:homoserine kinase|nr:homoserine kinase [Clostridiales bacterium]